MKPILIYAASILLFASCNTNLPKDTVSNAVSENDSITYPYTASYSSNLSMQTNPDIAKRVLTVWKMYENKEMDSMKPYYADTVTYDDASGMHYYGPAEGLLNIAKQEMATLDSLRFDISMWESVHSNDKNEDWVNIWCT